MTLSKTAIASSIALMMTISPAIQAQQDLVITDGQTTTAANPAGGTVSAAAGVTQTVANGDNIELENNTNDGTIITNAGILINNDATDEDVVIFIDNAEDDVVIINESTGVLSGLNGVVFLEGDATAITNNGLIEGTGLADEAVIYFDRDTDGSLNTINNNGTISSVGGATIGIDALLDVTNVSLVNTGNIINTDTLNGNSDAINLNGDPGSTDGVQRGCLEDGGATVLCQAEINFDNSGTISAARDNASNAAIRIEEDIVVGGVINNQSSGTIIGASNGIFVNGAHSDHSLAINNSGEITGTSAAGVIITGAGVSLTNQAGGTITGGDFGLQIADTTIDIDIGDSDLEGVSVLATNNTFINAGTISGATAAVDASGAATAFEFTQQGGGSLDGDFIGSQSLDTFNVAGGTGAFTLTNDILSNVNVNVAQDAALAFGGEGTRLIEGDLNSDGTLEW